MHKTLSHSSLVISSCYVCSSHDSDCQDCECLGLETNCFLHFVHTYIPDCDIISQKTVILTQLFSCELFKTQWHCFHLQIRENSVHFPWPVSGDFCCIIFAKQLHYLMLEDLECPIFPFICVCVCVLGSIIANILYILYKCITWIYIKTSYCWCFQDTSQSFPTFCRIERLFCCQKRSFLFHSPVLLWYN
jgi:hypothetical protein